MKNTFSLFLLVALAYGQTAYGQTANVQKSLATATLNQISGDLTFGSGKTLTMQSGSTLYAQSLTATGTNNNITLTPSGTGGVLFPDGSASSPAIAFVAAGGPLGLYRTGNSINFSSTGARVFFVSTQGITVNGSDSLGSASNPLIAISAAGTTGFFQTAAGSIGISNVGILTLTLDSSQKATFAGAVRFSTYGAGSATFDSAGNITSVSDARMKNITGPFTKGLAEIVKLNPKLYTWKPETGLVSDDVVASLIAQDIIAAGLPEAVTTYRTVPVMEDDVQSAEDIAAGKPITQHAKLDADGKAVTKRIDANYSVSDRTVIAALVNAVKELKAEIDALKAR